jgi:aspartyl-tRNA(Asn)/glutamyl-tRNA(Gln) amidotransferase subunit C
VSVTEHDVRHAAELARLGLDPTRVPALVRELSGILGHMDVLSKVDTRNVSPVLGVGAGGMPLRDDAGRSVELTRPREAFAPATGDGFFLVPRLATHGGAGGQGDGDADARGDA